jgi:hypothetical protein
MLTEGEEGYVHRRRVQHSVCINSLNPSTLLMEFSKLRFNSAKNKPPHPFLNTWNRLTLCLNREVIVVQDHVMGI